MMAAPDPARRGRLLFGGFALVLAVWPLGIDDAYLVSVAITMLWFAAVGQAWNLMMGFAGQLSLGHTLYVGLGAYTAAALYVHFGIGPWIGVWAAVAVAAAAGAVIGGLGFRFGVRGVYFALLTIAFAEFTRIGFDHLDWLGGSAGFFLPLDHDGALPWADLRGPPLLFYYLLLAYTLGLFLLCRAVIARPLGYRWRAVREDQEAAAASGINVFRTKLAAAVMSAALTAPAGVIQAFYYNNLFPDQAFAMHRSIEMILAPIVGGIGTLFGPILGAVVLTPLGEALTLGLEALAIDLPGLKQTVYGVLLVVIVLRLPSGVWPPLARRLGLGDAATRTPDR